MGCSELTVRVDEDLGLQNIVHAFLVYKTEVGHSNVWVYKTIKKDSKVTLAKCYSKGILGIDKS